LVAWFLRKQFDCYARGKSEKQLALQAVLSFGCKVGKWQPE